MKILSVKAMKKIESVNFKNRNSFFFMKKAGARCANKILKIQKSKNFLIYCGPGNNGGDGFIIGKTLLKKGYGVRIVSTIQINKYSGDALKALKQLDSNIVEKMSTKIREKDLIIDCIFGFGINRNINKKYTKLFDKINKSKNKVISIDFPSGINGDTGLPMKKAIKANYTLAIHSKKTGHLLNDGIEYSGKIRIINIGFKDYFNKDYYQENRPNLWKSSFPRKLKTSHKYTRGKLYIFGGQGDTAGASILSARLGFNYGK